MIGHCHEETGPSFGLGVNEKTSVLFQAKTVDQAGLSAIPSQQVQGLA